jgi:hypothetical protein
LRRISDAACSLRAPTPADFQESAKRSQDATIADESAAYVDVVGGTDDTDEEDVGTQSSEKPVEGDDETAPPLPGSPD